MTARRALLSRLQGSEVAEDLVAGGLRVLEALAKLVPDLTQLLARQERSRGAPGRRAGALGRERRRGMADEPRLELGDLRSKLATRRRGRFTLSGRRLPRLDGGPRVRVARR